ncbi:hypothetical protein [Nocardia sp. NPDC051570]|uniref:WXG100 family type VII secretion target n=1 Tax=Nocardia sp. NPDC051570 TaxID=3364324 RepID=UPI0037B74678
MSIYLPPELQWLGWIAGSAWPQGDEDQMWALAQDWFTTAATVKEQLRPLDAVITTANEAYTQGSGSAAIDAALRKLVEGDGSIAQMAAMLGDMGDAAQSMGTEIQYMKIMIICTLAELAFEILLAWIFPPTAPAAEAAAVATARAILQAAYKYSLGAIEKGLAKLIGTRLANFLVRHMMVSTVLGTGQDLLIQGIQVGQGHRKGIDGTQLAVTAAGAAAAGALGASPLGNAMETGLTKLFTKIHVPETGWKGFAAESGKGLLSGAWSGMVGGTAGWLAGAAAYSAATGTNLASNLQGSWGFQTMTSGVVGGGAAGFSKGAANFHSAGGFRGGSDAFSRTSTTHTDGSAEVPSDTRPRSEVTSDNASVHDVPANDHVQDQISTHGDPPPHHPLFDEPNPWASPVEPIRPRPVVDVPVEPNPWVSHAEPPGQSRPQVDLPVEPNPWAAPIEASGPPVLVNRPVVEIPEEPNPWASSADLRSPTNRPVADLPVEPNPWVSEWEHDVTPSNSNEPPIDDTATTGSGETHDSGSHHAPEPTPWGTGWELPGTSRFFPAPDVDDQYTEPDVPDIPFWIAPDGGSGRTTE